MLNLVVVKAKAETQASIPVDRKNGLASIHAAAAVGQAVAVSALVMKGVDINAVDRNGRTSLMVAIHHGRLTVVDTLLELGVDINFQDANSGESALYLASGYGHVEIVSALLQKGAHKDARDRDGRTALLAAAVTSRLAVLNTLLDAGADPNIPSNANLTALFAAALKGLCGVASALLRHGKTDMDVMSNSGSTPLCAAVAYRHTVVVYALLNAGADVNKFDREQEHALSPLAIAARMGDIDTTRLLLERSADVGATDLYGYTPLHWVCRRRPVNAGEVTDILLRAGADETLETCDNKTPEDLLKEEAASSPQCPAEEVCYVRKLLVGSPHDRTWRRWCWLVMPRSRASKARRAHDTATKGEVGRTCKLARNRGTEEGRMRDVQSSARTEAGGDGSLVVTSLLNLELEGVFRKVLGFL